MPPAVAEAPQDSESLLALAPAEGELELQTPDGVVPVQRPPSWRQRLASRLPAKHTYRAAVQLAVALFCASLYATSGNVYHLFRGKGLWAAITVTIALETNVGATWRKSSLRALGTLAGGALGALSVALTGLLCGGWQPGAPPGKVIVMALSLALLGAGVQYRRASDSRRDYAYGTCTMTMVLTALSSFDDPDSDSVLLSVAIRLTTIVIGGLMALATSLLCLPEYASQAAQVTLAKALREAKVLLTAVILEHGAVHSRVVLHPHLHSIELRLASLLEKYTVLVGQAMEEKRLRLGARLVDVERAEAAGLAARGLFTGAVAMLHVLESAPRSEEEAGMWALHSSVFDRVLQALDTLMDSAAALCETQGEAEATSAVAALRVMDSAMADLVAETQASAAASGAGSHAVREAHRDFAALVDAVQDASQCCARVVVNNLPEAHGLDWTGQLSAQQALARERVRTLRQLRNIRRTLTHTNELSASA